MNDPPSELVREILDYCIAYPDAKDTVQGILKWWLPHRSGAGEQEVRNALDHLISKGWIVQREITPNRTIYGLRKDRIGEIEKFLAG